MAKFHEINDVGEAAAVLRQRWYIRYLPGGDWWALTHQQYREWRAIVDSCTTLKPVGVTLAVVESAESGGTG